MSGYTDESVVNAIGAGIHTVKIMAQEKIKHEYIGTSLTKWEEGYDDGLKRGLQIVEEIVEDLLRERSE